MSLFIQTHYFSVVVLCRLGEVCSHVAAMLFKIETCVRLQIRQSVTDIACQWNRTYVKKVQLNGIMFCADYSVYWLIRVLVIVIVTDITGIQKQSYCCTGMV